MKLYWKLNPKINSPETRLKLSLINKGKYDKSFKLISPDGEIINGVGIAKFAKEHNLLVNELSKLLNKRRESYKGWTLFTEK